MSRTFRAAEIWTVGAGLAAFAVWSYGIGLIVDSSLLRFVGFMTGAGTFVPLPADAYVLDTADSHTALTIGVLGGLVNAGAVLVEREWILRLAAHPAFARFREWVGTNRWVDRVEGHLFLGLVVAGFSFLPFEPFRLLAVLRNYHWARFGLATFLGRGFRYYWLARVGLVFDRFGVVRYAVWASLALFGLGLARSYARFRKAAGSDVGAGVDVDN